MIFRSRGCSHLIALDATRHRSIVLSFECEFKAVSLGPVIEGLGYLDRCTCLYRAVSISYCQAVCAIVLDCCCQCIGCIICLGNIYDYLVSLSVIADSICSVIALCNCVLVLSSLGISDFAECRCRTLLCGSCFSECRHWRILSNCRQVECEAICLTPVIEGLGYLDCFRCLYRADGAIVAIEHGAHIHHVFVADPAHVLRGSSPMPNLHRVRFDNKGTCDLVRWDPEPD